MTGTGSPEDGFEERLRAALHDRAEGTAIGPPTVQAHPAPARRARTGVLVLSCAAVAVVLAGLVVASDDPGHDLRSEGLVTTTSDRPDASSTTSTSTTSEAIGTTSSTTVHESAGPPGVVGDPGAGEADTPAPGPTATELVVTVTAEHFNYANPFTAVYIEVDGPVLDRPLTAFDLDDGRGPRSLQNTTGTCAGMAGGGSSGGTWMYPEEAAHLRTNDVTNYRHSGTRSVTVELTGTTCEGQPYAERRTVQIEVVGDGGSNGPVLPQAAMGMTSDAPPSLRVGIYPRGDDRDGYVTDVTIDWGDGSEPFSARRDLTGCDDDGGRNYPSSSYEPPMQEHIYPAPGTYEMRRTVRSVGCQGADENVATEVVSITVPDAGGG